MISAVFGRSATMSAARMHQNMMYGMSLFMSAMLTQLQRHCAKMKQGEATAGVSAESYIVLAYPVGRSEPCPYDKAGSILALETAQPERF